MHISELETPTLLIDLDRMERNLDRAAAYSARHNLRMRPHTKTHKTPEIGRMQLDRGAVGLTVAKVGEAEVMRASGAPDLLVAYPILGESKLRRLMEVAREVAVTMALDSSEALRQLSAAASKAGVTIGVLVEANVGQNRCGLEPGPALVALAREVQSLPGVELAGVQFYAGHIWLTRPDGPALFAESIGKVQQIREDFHREGVEIKILSGGSTPLIFHSHEFEGMNEIRPGTYIFNDLSEVAAGAAALDDCAVTIMATVVSAPRPGQALIDGGSKTFTSDAIPWSEDKTFGLVTEAPSARLYSLNEEHGYLDVSKAERELKVGDRVRVIPNHVCVTVNMQEKIYGIRGETVEQEWVVAARGKLR